ncbi:hypothetical protein [Paraburkholderia tuberum]|uniref:hypothetical protein n=1 Tax=Paraburkholderia tuberum TaxID=157910 RepID=UPI00115FE58C|nr:hypothetical protein [Paraburkholderia tuberum]
MKKYLFLFFLMIFLGNACAAVVSSCDGNYLAMDDVRGQVTIKHDGRNIGLAKIDHAIRGGVFSLDGSMLVVFGLPTKIDANYPQVTHLSIFSVKPKMQLIEREVYGGGVYDAAFSVDKNFIVVENQFGVDVINLRKKKAQSFDAAYIPQFKTQQCSKN